MDELNNEVGGLRCRDVLAQLSAYLDGELDPEEVHRIEAHLAGCHRCERFGGSFSGVVTALRRELARPAALGEEVAGRLSERLRSIG